ncbi:MAG: hypothetical protein JST63_04040 [Bacteroidetes bacterium]|nr:hypothetical protein [Bacteroidota bacterium]
MLCKFRKSAHIIILGMAVTLVTFASCNSGQEEKKEDATTVKPADNTPAVDTTHMDSATTRPVKGGN